MTTDPSNPDPSNPDLSIPGKFVPYLDLPHVDYSSFHVGYTPSSHWVRREVTDKMRFMATQCPSYAISERRELEDYTEVNHVPLSSIITQEQFVNYCILASFLHALAKVPLNKRKAMFTMSTYHEERNGICPEQMIDCGTVGCAAGHGPFAGIPKVSGEFWIEYVNRCFGCQAFHGYNRFLSRDLDDAKKLLYYWTFASDWVAIDNTPEGAARRIDYAIVNGVPLDTMGQCRNDVRLVYEVPSDTV